MEPSVPLSSAEILPLAASGLGLLCAVAVVGLSLSRTTVRAALGLSGGVVGFGLAAVLLGAAGRFSGERQVLRALAYAAPDQREELARAGNGEVARAMTLGAVGGLPLLVVGIAAMVVLFPRVRAAAKGGAA